MVCHETYKNDMGEWISPEEIESINGEKVLKKNNSIKIKVGSSESMSKSKKNTIDPQKIIDQYGSDAVRLFILSDSPPEKDVQWSDEGIISAHKFIQKFWGLHQKIIAEISKEHPENKEDKITKYTTIGDNTGNIDGTIISFIADLVRMSTQVPYSGLPLPSIIPGISLNCLLTSNTTEPAALPTAVILKAPNKKGNKPPKSNPTTT